ncbi:hypothetical protein [Bythopirellula polymerisocia]|uniref:Uncharacterized protein n=1 Tax=Bythopirellula polymerisocia TaxID=2528003 RepID=A0A5C6CY80_9BACT|nr:hypothetical protein [Bythopirellula polymerisocia]TWU28441.1 hypothetical protein Pla144_17310 [Bythopirellula polymerisocia]
MFFLISPRSLKQLLLIISISISSFSQLLSDGSAETRGNQSAIPSIDEMASEWLEVDELAHMPSLHNFHDMAACAPDLIGVNYNPDGQLFDWPTGPRWFRYLTLPLLQLRVNGSECETTDCRWYPYQAVRRCSIDGLDFETTVRMEFEGSGLFYEILVTNSSDKERSVDLALEIPGVRLAETKDALVAYESNDPKLETAHAFGDSTPESEGTKTTLEMVHAFADTPDKIRELPEAIEASWNRVLKPDESTMLHLVMAHGQNNGEFPSQEVVKQASAWAADFEKSWQAVKSHWEERWNDVFAPGNGHFSGNLPTLITTNDKLSDIYYRSILTLLVLHRTNMAMCDRVFVTSGERDKGVVFFWDTSMWSKVFALLEPKAMKEHVKIFLSCDPHKGPVYGMDDGHQWEGWYAANDSTIFTFVSEYLNTTGDVAFLDEKVGDKTVLEHLDSLATNWKKLQRDKSVMLADYGENRNLLECAPAYVHRVPSFNAANVWMMRTTADFYEQRGNTKRAAELRNWADQFAQAVLDLYKSGDGVWYALHRNGDRVELRHCYDFVCIGRFMPDDLTPQMKEEMVEFVERELVTDHWMRAMSPLDKAAAESDRPDHGPMGAYDAWPALTAETMCILGAWGPAFNFLCDTQDVLYEGVYGQSREFYGEHRADHDAPVRIAMRGACMRESVGGGAFAEMIIGTLFGFRPQADQELSLFEADTDRGFEGKLLNVSFDGKLLDISSDSDGVSYRFQDE